MERGIEPDTTERYPLSDSAYDLITILHNKSQAVKAYDEYLHDVSSDTVLTQILVEIKHDDLRHIERLKGHLGRLLCDNKSGE